MFLIELILANLDFKVVLIIDIDKLYNELLLLLLPFSLRT